MSGGCDKGDGERVKRSDEEEDGRNICDVMKRCYTIHDIMIKCCK
jgi:hypothetical protein